MKETFEDRMYLGSEAVYAAIERGEMTSPAAVDAALLDTRLQASVDEEGAN